MGGVKHSEQVYIDYNIRCEVKLGKKMGLYDDITHCLAGCNLPSYVHRFSWHHDLWGNAQSDDVVHTQLRILQDKTQFYMLFWRNTGRVALQ
jgi:hypothetical protein